MLAVYKDFSESELAMPVMDGQKTESEKFAGADRTYSIEALMRDGRALQAGTSHNLGQNFSKSYEIKFQARDKSVQYAWTTSWGVSTRMVGAVIMAHGDDGGLILPPRVAPYQVVIVPIPRGNWKETVLPKAEELRKALVARGIRVFLTPAKVRRRVGSSTSGRCAACPCAWRSGRRISRSRRWCWRAAIRARSRSCRWRGWRRTSRGCWRRFSRRSSIAPWPSAPSTPVRPTPTTSSRRPWTGVLASSCRRGADPPTAKRRSRTRRRPRSATSRSPPRRPRGRCASSAASPPRRTPGSPKSVLTLEGAGGLDPPGAFRGLPGC